MKLRFKKGVDIPMSGSPKGPIVLLSAPKVGALNLKQFPHLRFKLHTKIDEEVKIGQPLVENKSLAGQFFVSPFAGKVVELKRGLKRQLEEIIIEKSENESFHEFPPLSIAESSKDDLLNRLMNSGVMTHIRHRPFNLLANPRFLPKNIFIKALETAPYTPCAEMQVEGKEALFHAGIDVLKKLAEKSVYLVIKENSSSSIFKNAKGVVLTEVTGPHPASNPSVHIHHIHPINRIEDFAWTLSAWDVVCIGKSVIEGRYHIEKVVGLGGSAIEEGKQAFFLGRSGMPLAQVLDNRLNENPARILSGDPLMGQEERKEGFLGFGHFVISAIPESEGRQALHFFRLGRNKYTATRTYLSGFFPFRSQSYEFSTNLHGEERAFIDGSIYQKMLPMKVPVMELVKAILTEDFEKAQELGLLEIAPEDFALPAFIDPCKIDMIDIVEQGLRRFAKEMGF